jgi:hypothetical protein
MTTFSLTVALLALTSTNLALSIASFVLLAIYLRKQNEKVSSLFLVGFIFSTFVFMVNFGATIFLIYCL